MYPKHHIILGAIFAAALYFIFPSIGILNAAIVFLSSFLIDVDHYIYYRYKTGNWNLKKAYDWFEERGRKLDCLPRKKREEFYLAFCFLHGIEVLIILFILSIFVSKHFLFIFTGVALHLILDTLHQTTYQDRIDKFSLIYDYLKFKKLKFAN